MEFPSVKFKLKKDRFQKTRGGTSKFLYISCAGCGEPAIVYQKDGGGRLKRCYADRIFWRQDMIAGEPPDRFKTITCCGCGQILAVPMIYKPEKRPAFRVLPGTISLHK